MHVLRRAGLTGFSAAMLLLAASPIRPVAAQAAPDISISDTSVAEGGTLAFTVTVVGAHPNFTVDYLSRPGTALEPGDYAPTAGTLTIGKNQFVATINVPTVQDGINEPDESMFIDLDPASTIANVVDGTGQGDILDDDPIPGFSVDDVLVSEGDSGLTDAIFTVTPSNASSVDMSVSYRTVPGTALGGGDDYRNTTGTLVFPAGSAAPQQVVVKVKGDTVHESNETFTLRLYAPVNAVLADAEGTGTIKNDDRTPQLSLGTSAINVVEGNSNFPQLMVLATVSATNPSDQDMTFTASTLNGTALAGSDYTELNAVLYTIPAGSTSVRVAVPIKGDTVHENDENFFLSIDNATASTLGNSVQEIVIKNDD